MVKQCAGLVGTDDLSVWEEEFMFSVLEQTKQGDNTTSLTEKQIDVVESIFDKHFIRT